ncbi:tyrosine-type recombinase/integrase [Glutamicibacter arilaitensis]|uniref:tyrosine-type recombinase/integrase n=1 Tax=Glutamicibacter arilaitensis TaxID=256701 RepID=UPI00384A562A
MTLETEKPKRTRRGNGEGTKPYQRKDGVWRTELTIGQRPDGSMIRKAIYGATSAECTRNLRAAKKNLDNGILVSTSSMRFIDWLDHWLDNVPTTRIKPRTMVDYRGKINRYVRPHRAGMKRLDKLQPEDLEQIYQAMREPWDPPKGSKVKARSGALSESTIAGVHRVLTRGLNVAVQRKHLGVNPANLLDAPQPAKFNPTVLKTAEVKALITAALKLDDGARWVFSLTLGPRQGEALGLAWTDIDFETGKLSIERELYTLSWKHGCAGGEDDPSCGRKRGDGCPERQGGGFFMGDPKSDAGTRAPIMPKQLKDSLRHHRKVQLANRSDSWSPYVDQDGNSYDLVFARPDGRPTDYRADWGAWKEFCRSAGVPEVRLHDGRHTAATTLLLLGIEPRVVMDILGWSQTAMLTRYQHVLDEMKQDAADKISNMWADDPVQSNVVSLDDLRRRRANK